MSSSVSYLIGSAPAPAKVTEGSARLAPAGFFCFSSPAPCRRHPITSSTLPLVSLGITIPVQAQIWLSLQRASFG
ncbi:hypothetical protein MPTK1_6g09600 [Marchantia polymorpha subsp. ruderalis]|uniref:Uncharacterized protein n=2 Tax=Marchantia polymorpha TaxID=3197 RepID=A0AAF6BQA1_MARPO|nr:hypothetical protein MARPO_0016s0004 [Marchantia polymorpha]BBN14185.1 hypothetical protein Mp_6g09600 [Marchantia polymorpha subsp. ruderalis]|eukprot:PTQ44918.1 hypothetical protein MARPO_0016s0004 [Marchantia polymorpha]